MTSALFLVVVVAASGVASLVALKPVAPTSSPVIALTIMAIGFLSAAWRRHRD